MYSTDQYRVFPSSPAERALSRPRRLVSEGRVAEAEEAYRTVLRMEPELKPAWLEYFALLRQGGRHDDALRLADEAQARFGTHALPLAMRGAALVELGRYRDGLEALDQAACLDPDMGLIWHEAGYAAWRLGELSRALMALDRAFALEPHSGTLHLRGKVLRAAGRYLAAEVAFEGAAEAAEFPIQREAAAHEIRVTRRFSAYPGSRPEALGAAERWFAAEGAVSLTGGRGAPATDPEVAAGLLTVCQTMDWRFTRVVALDGWEEWYRLAQGLCVPVADGLTGAADEVPLVVARSCSATDWPAFNGAVLSTGRGASFVLRQAVEGAAGDLCGHLGSRAEGPVRLEHALEAARHPESRLATRILR